MKKDLGSVVSLYPTPVTIVGTVVNGRVNWINIAHIGIWGLQGMMLSINRKHYSNQGILEFGTLSINLATEDMMEEADYVGIVSGRTTDKSTVFDYTMEALPGAPLITKSPVSMACNVIDVLQTPSHYNYVVEPVHTFVDESALTEDGKIDIAHIRPLLFEMPQRRYLATGRVLGNCWSVGKKYQPTES